MSYQGDYDAGTVIRFKFNTFQPSTGAPFALAGSPSLIAFKDDSDVQDTDGLTLTASFDSRTGLNHVAVDTSADATFYSAGSSFDIVLAAGTVDSVSVANVLVGSFTLRKDSSLKPTAAARTLDVTTTGAAGIDWANVENPTTAVNLSATNIDVDQVVASVSGSVASVTALAANSVNASALATDAVDEIVDAVWDEVLTAATHNVATSAGRRLRQLSDVVVHDGTAQGPGTGTNQIQLATDASATDGAYDPAVIAIVLGTGAGQCRLILQYEGSTRTATVDRDWKVNPDATSVYQVTANPGREHVNEGLAQGGGASTITLNALASAEDDCYRGQLIFLRSGTGADQGGLVVSYNGTTKVATVDAPWGTIPDTTTAYAMLPTGPVLLGSVVHTGATVPTVTAVSGSVGSVAADGITSASLAASAGSEIAAAVWAEATRTLTAIDEDSTTLDLDATIRAAVGLTSANLDTQFGDLPTATENADELLNRDMSAVSDSNSRSPLNALRFIRNKWDVAAGTLTVKKEDDSTTAWTATVSTSAGADPIVGNDPA